MKQEEIINKLNLMIDDLEELWRSKKLSDKSIKLLTDIEEKVMQLKKENTK